MPSPIKRHFGPSHFVLNGTLSGVALARLVRGPRDERARRLAQAVAHGAPAAIGARILTLRRGRTSEHLAAFQIASVAGTVALAAQGRAARRDALRAAVLAVGGNAAYVYWYSRLGRTPSHALAVGNRIPDVTFVDQDGVAVSTRDLGGRPTAYMFLRGNWCPVCMAQAGELAARYQELERLGVQVALVSAQSERQTQQLAKRLGVSFRYLHDPGLRGARELGLFHAGGTVPGIPGYDPDTIFPTVVVTDAGGRIVFCHQTDNYRVRPEPDLILNALRGVAQPAADGNGSGSFAASRLPS